MDTEAGYQHGVISVQVEVSSGNIRQHRGCAVLDAVVVVDAGGSATGGGISFNLQVLEITKLKFELQNFKLFFVNTSQMLSLATAVLIPSVIAAELLGFKMRIVSL